MRTYIFRICYDSPTLDGGAGGGIGAPAPAAPAAPAPAPAPSAAPGDPGRPPAPTPPPEPDRSGWVDPNTVRPYLERGAVAEQRAQMLQRMLEAAHGFKMPGLESPEERQQQEARTALLQLYPSLKHLDGLDQLLPKIQELLQTAPQLTASAQQYWERQGHATFRSLYGQVAKEYGTTADKLSGDFKADFANTFMQWMQRDQSRAERYYRGDDGLETEFLTYWRSGYIDPIRRTAQAPAARVASVNRGLPQAPQPSGPPAPTPPPPAADDDEVHDRAFADFHAGAVATRR